MVGPAPGYSGGEAMAALEEAFEASMPSGMGYDYMGMSYQAKVASEGISPMVIFAFSLLMVFPDSGRPIRKLVTPLQCLAHDTRRRSGRVRRRMVSFVRK